MFDADYQDSHPATPPAALHPTVNQTTTSAATSTTTSTATTTGASQAMALPAPEQLNNGGATAATSQQPQPQPQHQHRPHKRRSIGDWDFEDSIGAGSMGQVKRARNRVTGMQCAVKVIPKGHAERRKSEKPEKESDKAKDVRSVREASIGRLLHHRNICQLYEVYSMTNHFYLLFEYVAGGQLLDYIISHGSLKEKNARKFARSITSALDYCHHNSIVHRDLKIENIMISDSGEIKIIDFGLSNLYRPDQLLKTFCGSLYFAAPELLNAEPYVGPAIDVWSLGIVLYVLVCGKVPFDDQSMPALHEKIKKGKVEYPHWLSVECRDLLQRILVVNSKERITLHEVMTHPWMIRGYDGPPESHVPPRRPIVAPLNPMIIQQMAEYEFGNYDYIKSTLDKVLNSQQYIEAVENWYKINDVSPSRSHDSAASYVSYGASSNSGDSTGALSPSASANHNRITTTLSQGSPQHGSRSKHFGFDFHRRSLSFGLGDHHAPQVDQFSATAEMLQPGMADPTDAYHPYLSLYYLIQEDMERKAHQRSAANLSRGTSLSARHQHLRNTSNSAAVSSGTSSDYASPNRNDRPSDAEPWGVAPPTTGIPVAQAITNAAAPTAKPKQPAAYDLPTVSVPDPVHAVTHATTHGLIEIAPQPLETPATPTPAVEKTSKRSNPGTGGRSRSRTQGAAEMQLAVAEANRRSESPLQNPFSSYNTSPVKDGFNNQKIRQQVPERKSSKRHQSRYSEPQNSLSNSSPAPKSSGGFAGNLLRSLSSKGRKQNANSNSTVHRKASMTGTSSISISAKKSSSNNGSSSPPPPIPPLPDDFKYPMVAIPNRSGSNNQTQPVPPPSRGTQEVETKMENLSINSPAAKNRTKQYHPSARAKSMGHARRESALARYYQEGSHPSNGNGGPENRSGNNLFDDIALDSPTERFRAKFIVDDEKMPSIQYPKQVFLKGFFSVQSTSTKSLLYIRSDIIRVLEHLGISFREVEGGFLCYHRPSIRSSEDDYASQNNSGTNTALTISNSPPASPQATGHWRKRSLGSGLNSANRRKSSGVFNNANASSSTESNHADSDMSNESLGEAGATNGGSDMLGHYGGQPSRRPTPLRFEVYIVKVPLLTLYGIQFKKLTGNSWQYKNLASKILGELRL